VDLLQDSFRPGPAAKDYTAAFRSQISCDNKSTVFHFRHSSLKPHVQNLLKDIEAGSSGR